MASFVTEDGICVFERAFLSMARLWETSLQHFMHNFTSVSKLTAEQNVPEQWDGCEYRVWVWQTLTTERPQRRHASFLHKSSGSRNIFRCDLFHPGILLVISIPRRQRLCCSSIPPGLLAATGLLTVQRRFALIKSVFAPLELVEYVCLLGKVGVGSKPLQIFDSYSSVCLILCFLSLCINISDTPSVVGCIKQRGVLVPQKVLLMLLDGTWTNSTNLRWGSAITIH